MKSSTKAWALPPVSLLDSTKNDSLSLTPEFINDGLFKPFKTTKGVSGMGVGVYQSREYIRSITGEIEVSSEPGIGARFKILIPVDYE